MIEKRDYAFVSKLGQIIKSSIPNIPEYIEKAKSYIATNYKDRYKKSSYIFDPKTPEGIIEKTIYTKIPKEIASNDNISMFDAMSKLYNRSIYVDDNGNNYMFDYGMSEHEEGATNTPIISATFKIPQIAKYNGQTYMTYKMDKKTAIIDIDSSKMNNNFLYINGIMTPYGKAFIQELVNTLFQLKDENDDLYDKRLSFAESNKDNEDVNKKIEDM
jgi:sensor c-di-GMP phosphodiesterase-like protein